MPTHILNHRPMKTNKVVVNGVEILFYKKEEVEFISLTDIAKKFNKNTDVVIQFKQRRAIHSITGYRCPPI